MSNENVVCELQLALDVLSIDDALRVVSSVADLVDVIEAGTPLIKSEGIRCVARLRAEYPDLRIVADMKTIDTGAIDAAMAFDNGADAVIFQASAPQQTVKSVVEETRRRGKQCMIDSLGINDMVKFERLVEHSGADCAIIHTGIDEQRDGFRPLDRLKRIHRGAKLPRLAVAGGIGPDSVGPIVELLASGIVIVGTEISRAQNPRNVACRIREIMKRHGV